MIAPPTGGCGAENLEPTKAAPLFVDGRALPVAPALVIYALVHFAAAGIGYQLRLSQDLATVFWPPAGLLLTALWLISAAHWPVLLAAAFIAELAAGFIFGESQPGSAGAWVETAYYAIANLCCGAIAAGAIRRRVSIERTPAVPAVLSMILIGALAALVGAVLGALGLSILFSRGDFLDNLQLWWANTWLGFVIIAPVTAAWYRHFSGRSHIVVRARPIEFALVYGVALALAVAVFVAPPTPLLQLPHLLFIPVVWSGLRLAPRHSMLIALIVTLIAVVGTRAGLGTFAPSQDEVARTLSLQIFLASIALLPLFIGLVNEERERDVTELKRVQMALRHERERLRELALELVEAEERARQRLARTLHDGLGQDLYGMSLLLGALRGRVGDNPGVQEELKEAERLARGAAESTRGVINDLSPPGLYELGLGPALEWLVARMKSRYALEVELRLEGMLDGVGLPTRVLVFRAISELLVNVAKHAQTDRASVSVRRRGDCLEAEVVDRGRGFDTVTTASPQRAEGGFGLLSLNDQIRTAAGEFAIDSTPGAGTRIRFRVPCDGVEVASPRNEVT